MSLFLTGLHIAGVCLVVFQLCVAERKQIRLFESALQGNLCRQVEDNAMLRQQSCYEAVLLLFLMGNCIGSQVH